MPRVALALALVLAALPARPGAAEDRLAVDEPVTAIVAGGALAAWGGLALAKPWLAPAACRWCEPPALDRSARAHLLWHDAEAASALSVGLVVGVPVALAAADLVLARGDLHRAGQDALVVAEAVAVAGIATEVSKYAIGRRRPYAQAAGVRHAADDDLSFVSGHTASAFAAAGAFGTVARLRGDAAWPWIYGTGFAAAGFVGYLRVAADRHWLTDVASGALLGTAVGVAMPLLLHRRAGDEGAVKLAVTPLPLGIVGTF